MACIEIITNRQRITVGLAQGYGPWFNLVSTVPQSFTGGQAPLPGQAPPVRFRPVACVQISCNMLAGASPVSVIAKKPGS